MLTSYLKMIDQYDYLEEKFRKGYEFLRTADLKSLPLGRVEINGEALYANVQEYMTTAAANNQFEAHNHYFDIQYVVEGEELFGYAKRSGLVEADLYNEADDIVFFEEPETCGMVLLKAGDCAVVAPEDAHKPRCMVAKSCKVRKIVLKVRME